MALRCLLRRVPGPVLLRPAHGAPPPPPASRRLMGTVSQSSQDEARRRAILHEGLERLGRLRESIRVRREASIEEAKRSKVEQEELPRVANLGLADYQRAVENLTKIRKAAATAAVVGMPLLAVAGIQYL